MLSNPIKFASIKKSVLQTSSKKNKSKKTATLELIKEAKRPPNNPIYNAYIRARTAVTVLKLSCDSSHNVNKFIKIIRGNPKPETIKAEYKALMAEIKSNPIEIKVFTKRITCALKHNPHLVSPLNNAIPQLFKFLGQASPRVKSYSKWIPKWAKFIKKQPVSSDLKSGLKALARFYKEVSESKTEKIPKESKKEFQDLSEALDSAQSKIRPDRFKLTAKYVQSRHLLEFNSVISVGDVAGVVLGVLSQNSSTPKRAMLGSIKLFHQAPIKAGEETPPKCLIKNTEKFIRVLYLR